MSSAPALPKSALPGGAELVMQAPATHLPALFSAETRDQRLAALLDGWFRMVWRALRRFGVPASAADDAAQEVFIIASRKLEQIEPGHERQFLYAVAIRVAANVRRARAVRREESGSEWVDLEPSGTPSPEALLDRKRARERLELILESMPEELRTAFVLFELEGCSGPEVAELLQIPLGTAASRLRRGREIFRAAVARLKSELEEDAGHG